MKTGKPGVRQGGGKDTVFIKVFHFFDPRCMVKRFGEYLCSQF